MKTCRSILALAVALPLTLSFSLPQNVHAQTVSFIAQFTGPQGSATGVVQATDGNFYGVTGIGGAKLVGQVFRMTPAGEISTIYSFCSQSHCADGEYPGPAPILGRDGNLYGVTYGGNTNPSGTLYRATLQGKLATVYTFCAASCADGEFPNGVIQASDGNFYGTTGVGGNSDSGTIFQISPAGKFKLLYTFCSITNCVDGSQPFFPPIQGSDGNFYGTTFEGGSQGGGVVYQLTPSGRYTVLHNFCAQNDGTCEWGSGPSTVVQDADGNLFGTTQYGLQVAFEITSTHQYRLLHRINVGSPFTGFTLANDGNFYGTTQAGGFAGEGTIFEVTQAGEFAALYSFASSSGYDPSLAPLFQGTDGLLYGTTLYGPGGCCYGTIFTLDNGLSPLVKTVPVASGVGTNVLSSATD